MHQRRKRNSSKVNLTISFAFHSVLVVGLFIFAAREGILGKKLKEITVTLAPKEKKPEPPKEKPPEPKVEPSKPAEAPKLAVAPPKVETAPPPAAQEAPAVAPAMVNLPEMQFDDGAKDVQSVSDANTLYKSLVERALRSRWSRPEDIADEQFVAEVELSVDREGKVTGSRWVKGSGNSRWDSSVKAAVAATRQISRPPPKGFPASFVARFDVTSEQTEEVFHVSSR